MSRVNFTGRKRITHDHVLVPGTGLGRKPRATASLQLGHLGLPSESAVVIEFYRRTTSVRHDAGTVYEPRPVSYDFSDFGQAEGVLVRVRVLSTKDEDRGKLLAVADKVRIDWELENGATRSLLPFRASDSLGELVWELDLGDEPVVLVNSKLPDWNAFALSPQFVALVYHEALRQVGLWLVANEADEEGPVQDWTRFFEVLTKQPTPFGEDDASALEEWTRTACVEFSSNHGLLSLIPDDEGSNS